ncbi:MAG TPA: hypothetical protein EYP25_07665 [Anaerolineae bacterium]|nr:hypothetical protein [Caldilineae bacterium]HID34429.1 hypothetical protein [Anaerolineae bacterium]HIQ12263.1 hypothetical protein [Caldilineales bacterium]
MSFLDLIKKAFSSPNSDRNYWVHVRCDRCGEVITARVDLYNDLSMDFDVKQYRVHKVLVGTGRYHCFQRIEVTLVFDKNKRLVDRSIHGGTFLAPEDVAEAKAAYDRAMQEAEEARKARLAKLAARASESEAKESLSNPQF